MTKPIRMILAACLGLVAFHATPAGAGTTAYLSHTGSGTACTLGSPCSNMANAVTAAGTGGEVICLDKGNYGGVTIDFSITVSCGDGLWEASAGLLGISTPAGADVVLEGLVSDSLAAFSGPIMTFNGQGSLHLRRVRLGNVPGIAQGLFFIPTGAAKLFVTDSYFYNNGTFGLSAGINIKPASGVTASVEIARTRFENDFFGIVAD